MKNPTRRLEALFLGSDENLRTVAEEEGSPVVVGDEDAPHVRRARRCKGKENTRAPASASAGISQ